MIKRILKIALVAVSAVLLMGLSLARMIIRAVVRCATNIR